jgi:sugar/nucleoside kinase (ribokinase family)
VQCDLPPTVTIQALKIAKSIKKHKILTVLDLEGDLDPNIANYCDIILLDESDLSKLIPMKNR